MREITYDGDIKYWTEIGENVWPAIPVDYPVFKTLWPMSLN